MDAEGEPVIIEEKNAYRLYKYGSEKELERFVVDHAQLIFGKDTIYLDIKKKITSAKGISAIPDGLLLDFGRNKFYIVEIELITHDIIRHIGGQLDSFKLAMNNSVTHTQIAEAFHSKIIQDHLESSIGLAKIQQIISRQHGIIVVIDSVSKKLEEVFDLKEKDGTEVFAIPFETYTNPRGNHLHKFTTFTKEALENESKKWSFKWTTVPVEKHLEKASDDIKEVFTELSGRICCIDPCVKEVSRKAWTTYQTGPLKNFCTVKIKGDALEISLKADKKRFSDEKGIAKDIERTPAWTFDKVFCVRSKGELDYAISLIRQAHSCVCNQDK